MSENCTIKDVARRSRTSVGTVSRYLNGVGCSPERAERIRQAIKELHYIPNPHARAVRSANKRNIGIFISSLSISSTQWIYALLFALTRQCTALGVFSYVYEVDYNAGNRRELRQALAMLDGVVTIGKFADDFYGVFDDFPELSVVTYGEPVRCANGISLLLDMDHAITEAVKHLVSCGHRRIGVVSNVLGGKAKEEAFLQAVHKSFPDYDENLIVRADDNAHVSACGRKCTAELLDEHPEITAIFYFSDGFLPGALGELGKRQLRVPEDISVISMDNSPLCIQFEPDISSVGFDYEQVAETMLKHCIARIEKKEAPLSPLIFRKFICRGSSGVCRKNSLFQV